MPAGTELNLNGYDDTVELVAPGQKIAAPEIGRAIPDTGSFEINRDGSLASVYFESDQPYVVNGIALWNTVTWQYDAKSFGMGRQRMPVSVTGALVSDVTVKGQTFMADEDVLIRLSDGAVTPQ